MTEAKVKELLEDFKTRDADYLVLRLPEVLEILSSWLKLREAIEGCLEYWNGDENPEAMANALYEIEQRLTVALEDSK